MADQKPMPEHLKNVLDYAIEQATSEHYRKRAVAAQKESEASAAREVIPCKNGEMPEHLARGLDEFIQAARDALLEKQARAAKNEEAD